MMLLFMTEFNTYEKSGDIKKEKYEVKERFAK